MMSEGANLYDIEPTKNRGIGDWMARRWNRGTLQVQEVLVGFEDKAVEWVILPRERKE